MQTAARLILLGLFIFQEGTVKGKLNVSLNCRPPPDPVFSGQNVSVFCWIDSDNEKCKFGHHVSCFRDRSVEVECTGSQHAQRNDTVQIHNVTDSGNYVLDFLFGCGGYRRFSFDVRMQAKPDTRQSIDTDPARPQTPSTQTSLYVGLFVGALVALVLVALIIYGIRRARRRTSDYNTPPHTEEAV